MAEALPEYPDSEFSDDSTDHEGPFVRASDHVRKITDKLDNNQLLALYGLYKQGTEGSCNTEKPGWFDGRGRRKWDAWRALRDMSKDEAQEKYVTLVSKLDPDFSPVESKPTRESWVAVSSLRWSPEPEIKPENLSLIDAAREDCGDQIEKLLKQDPALAVLRDSDGLTALHWAADRNAINALRATIAGGISHMTVDDCGQTALHYSAACGHVAATKILLEAGADPLVKDAEDCTPLDLAADEEIRVLLKSYIS